MKTKTTGIINKPLIAKAMGILANIEGLLLLLAMTVSLLYNEPTYKSFLLAAIINITIGTLLIISGRRCDTRMTRRDVYFIIPATWLMFTILGMLPYITSKEIPTLTDAFFETMSGFTTTGFSIVDNVEKLSHGTQFWRVLTQWIGGLGIMCFTIALLPIFGGGNISLFSAESTGVSRDRLHPRISSSAKLIWTVYILLTTLCTTLLFLGGMNTFDSICHSLSILGTGGYSTRNASLAAWNNPYIHYTAAIFMLISGLNYTLLIRCLRGRFRPLLRDGETHWFLTSVLLLTLAITATLFLTRHYPLEQAFRKAFFTVSSVHTSCGLFIEDYTHWPTFTYMLLLWAMLTGGSTGSTAGGIKASRFMLLAKAVRNRFSRLIHPGAVLPVRLGGQNIRDALLGDVAVFIVFYFICAIIGATLLISLDIPFMEAVTTAISSLSNIGVSFGLHSPEHTMATLPEAAKWIISTLMLIGRLELFSVLVLFTPVFWKDW